MRTSPFDPDRRVHTKDPVKFINTLNQRLKKIERQHHIKIKITATLGVDDKTVDITDFPTTALHLDDFLDSLLEDLGGHYV